MRILEQKRVKNGSDVLVFWAAFLLIVHLSFGLSVSFAHEGHHGPELAQARYGGILQTGKKEGALEVVQEGSEIKIYAYDHHMDLVKPQALSLNGYYKLPRQKEKTNIVFSEGDNHFKATVNTQGAHRFELNLKAVFKGDTESSEENFRFQIEPNN